MKWASRRHRLTAFFALVAVALYLCLFPLIVPAAEVLSTASISTEKIRYVDYADRTAIPVFGMRWDLEGPCVDGRLLPKAPAEVVYGRTGTGPLEIEIMPGAGGKEGDDILAVYLPRGEGTSKDIRTRIYLQWDNACAKTPSSQARRHPGEESPPPLPVSGSISIGQEPTMSMAAGLPKPQLLLSGRLSVSARALGYFSPRTLYPVKDVILPVGSRLEAGDGFAASGGSPRWWGVAMTDAGKPGLSVEVSTEASRFLLFHPGPRNREADIIHVSRLTQLGEDPGLQRLNFALMFVIVSVVAFFVAGWMDRHKED